MISAAPTAFAPRIRADIKSFGGPEAFAANVPKDVMLYCKKNSDMEKIRGFMTAFRMLTIQKKYYALLNDAYTFYNARCDVFGKSL